MTDIRFKYDCFLCEQKFQFGPNSYVGEYIAEWKINVCGNCTYYQSDGVPPGYTEKLESYLEAKGFSYERDKKGCIMWPR